MLKLYSGFNSPFEFVVFAILVSRIYMISEVKIRAMVQVNSSLKNKQSMIYGHYPYMVICWRHLSYFNYLYAFNIQSANIRSEHAQI